MSWFWETSSTIRFCFVSTLLQAQVKEAPVWKSPLSGRVAGMLCVCFPVDGGNTGADSSATFAVILDFNFDSFYILTLTADRVLHHFKEPGCLLVANTGRAQMLMDTNVMKFLEMQWHFYYLLTFRYKVNVGAEPW